MENFKHVIIHIAYSCQDNFMNNSVVDMCIMPS